MRQPLNGKKIETAAQPGGPETICLGEEGRLTGDLSDFREFAEHLSAMIWMTNPEGRRVWSNNEWREFTGRTDQQESGSGWTRIVHPADLDELKQARLAAIRSEARAAMEYRVQRRDGEYRWILDNMVPRRDDDGGLIGFLTTAVDITALKQARNQLAQEQGFSQAVLEHMPGLCFVLDQTGHLLLWNRHAEDVTGYAREELLHRHVSEFISESQRATVLDQIEGVMNSGRGDIDAGVVTKTAKTIPYYFSARRIEWDGRPCFMGVGNDLTERRKTENLLRLNHAALNAAANAIIITNATGVIQWVNPAFSRLTGYEAAEVIGGQPNLLKSGQHTPAFYRKLWETITSGQVWEGQVINRRKDGSVYPEEMTITPVRDEQGRTTAFIAIQQDATERNAAQARLREQATLLDQASDAILVCDLADTVRYWNRGAETLFGWTEAEAVGRATAELLAIDSAAFASARAEVLRSGQWSGELPHSSRHQREIVCQTRWTLVRNEAGEPQSILVIITDITEKKKLEAQFLRAQRLESIGQLAGGIAHDLNNILTPILIAAPMLREGIMDPDSLSMLDAMEASAQRGAGIVKQVLTFSRGIEGDKVPVQLRHVVKEFGRIIHETFPRSVTLKVEEKRDLWLVKGDSTQLHQVLMNLCVNARDAMPDGGILSIRLENVILDATASAAIPGARPGPHVLLRVSDTGTGISPGNVERIFDPFFTTKETGKGTGLGLSTVLGIVKSHEGVIQVNTELKEGTEFKVYLPAMEATTDAPQPNVRSSDQRGNGELVMVVDDEPSIRQICQRMLESNGYRVITARDGLEAVELFQQRKGEIGVVITDLSMPRMDGVTLIHALCSEPPYPRIIVASGMLSGIEAETLKNLDVEAILVKPLTASGLLRALGAAIKPRPEIACAQ